MRRLDDSTVSKPEEEDQTALRSWGGKKKVRQVVRIEIIKRRIKEKEGFELNSLGRRDMVSGSGAGKKVNEPV